LTTPAEVFVVQLARASRKANRLVRNLGRADREDIMGSALAWCWEQRENYSLTTSLDTWFVNAVKNEYARWRRGERRNSATVLEAIPTGDSTLATVEAWEAATKLAAALPPEYRQVAELDARGYTRTEMEAKGMSKSIIDATRSRIRQLRKLVPEDQDFRRLMRKRTPPSSDARHSKNYVDHEIEQLEMMPKHGADCPPCWKCKWFEGYLPGAHKRVEMVIQEPEVAASVKNTEARKIEIAKRVRAGG
jgi:DNA-directed RNA polymerase specialized sigma24 family protein